MEKAGLLGPNQKAHHIVEFNGKTPEAKALRDKLEKAGIDINDLDNGIGLETHAGQHYGGYVEAVSERLAGLTDPVDIRAELRKIGRELQAIDQDVTSGKRKIQKHAKAPGGRTLREWVKDQIEKKAKKNEKAQKKQ